MTASASDRPAPPPSHTVSILPAAAVLVIAVVTLGIFSFINLLDSPAPAPTAPVIVVGGLAADPHTTCFAHFSVGGEPPADIASGLTAPVGTSCLGAVVTGGGGAGNYDLGTRLGTAAARAHLLGFYRSNLVALGWTLFSETTSTAHTARLLFQKAGSDGWYWEAGIVATATSPRTTTYTYRLFQASDFS